MRYQNAESYLHQNSFPFSSRKLTYSVDARLNALEPRLSWFYIRLLVFTGVAWAIQAAELVLLIFTQSLVANDIGMGESVLDIHNASIFMGSTIGGPVFGHVADRFGRRITLVIAMVFTLGGLVVSAAANAGYLLIIGRIIAGLGFGGQHSATVVLIQELAPRSIRGRLISLLDAFTGIGGLIGVALAFALAPWLEWRITYLVVCGFVLYALVLWFTMPESPRWLASVGRTEEAFDIVEKIELVHCLKSAGENVPKENLGFMSVQEVPSSAVKSSRLKRLFPTLILWTLWIAVTLSSYSLGVYVPILIGFKGYNVFASWSTIGWLDLSQQQEFWTLTDCIVASLSLVLLLQLSLLY
ncbi:Major Facilitator Superfamily (MFS) [Phytophthora palmivora]|uniref:Major Facilitator Superfamily (MFS) n=1 Tax=Phytophthora palmivora TaxID=4796 RepID=A0A2P4Y3X3_9STRA|nr:Major Facilitator Superfamily (MFS) [Phytophthora palmivora]